MAISFQILLRQLRGLADRQPDSPSDADLLARFVGQRDEAAFELLVWRHGGMVQRVCRNLLRREPDIEDAFQATFLSLARDAGRITQRESCAGWLYRVAFRMANKLRLRRSPVEALPNEIAGVDGDPGQLAARKEQLALLFEEIERLPRHYRETVVLCLLEGKTRSQAAQQLNCPDGTIDSRLAWARKRLRNRLLRRGVAPAVATAITLTLAEAATAVSTQLAGSVIRLSMLFAHGGSPALVGAVSTQTMNLLHGVTMTSTKIKVVLAATLLLGLIGVVTQGRFDHAAVADDPPMGKAGKEKPAEAAWRLMFQSKTGSSPITCLMFAADGEILATNGGTPEKPQLLSLDIPTGKTINSWALASSPQLLAISPDGKRLAVAEGSGQVILRFVDGSGQPVGWRNPKQRVLSMAFSPDGKVLATGTAEGNVRIRAIEKLSEISDLVIPVEKAAVEALAFTPDGKRLLTSGDGNVRIWDAATGKQLSESVDWNRGKRDIACSPDGKFVAVARPGQVSLLDIASGNLVRTINLGAMKGAQATQDVSTVMFSPDGKELAIAANPLLSDDPTGKGEIRIFSLATGQQISLITLPVGFVLRMSWSPDGKYIAAGSHDGVVYLWGRHATQPAAVAPAPKTTSGLDKLIEELVRSKRSTDACVEALFLATLGRFPLETEKKFTAEHVSKTADRREALRDVLFQLANTREFQEHLAALQGQAPR